MKTAFLALAIFTFGGGAVAAPSGRLGGIYKGTAAVIEARTGQVKLLPNGTRAWKVSAGPTGNVVYFVTPAGKPTGDDQSAEAPKIGYIGRPPYTKAALLPRGLQNKVPSQLGWNPGGNLFYAGDYHWSAVFAPASNTVRPSPMFASMTNDGRLMAGSDEKSIWVRVASDGKKRVIFDAKSPQALFDALKRAKSPKRLEDLTGGMDPSLWKDLNNWSLSEPALAPDGSRVYFAANAGSGMGAAGNTTFALFSFDLKTNKLAVMSAVGALFGRTPFFFGVSPDGKRLLMSVSVHDSAADNSFYVMVVDLLTQQSRQLLDGIPAAKGKTNLVDSVCWSPDSKYVALAAYFYSVEEITKKGDWSDPKDADWTTYIVDAGTGKLERKLAAVREVSWGR